MVVAPLQVSLEPPPMLLAGSFEVGHTVFFIGARVSLKGKSGVVRGPGQGDRIRVDFGVTKEDLPPSEVPQPFRAGPRPPPVVARSSEPAIDLRRLACALS